MTDIIENHAIDSETDLSELERDQERDDFSELESESLPRAQDSKKFQRWCQTVRARVEKIFITFWRNFCRE